MRAFAVALLIAVAVFCCPLARAQVPNFTILSITTDPPGPLLPGSKFKIKVVVRNDGDTIPAGRRFDFIFASADPLIIGLPTGTPALFFGFCPGSTSTRVTCQCSAAWEKGQTVEMETEVTLLTGARTSVMVTFEVRSGNTTNNATATVQLLRGVDLQPKVTLTAVVLEIEMAEGGGILKTTTRERPMPHGEIVKRGEGIMVKVDVENVGDVENQGSFTVFLTLPPSPAALSSINWPGCGPDFPSSRHTSSAKIPPGGKITLCQALFAGAGSLAVKIAAETSSGEDRNSVNNVGRSEFFEIEDLRAMGPIPAPVVIQVRGRQ